jgi:hypothetical protein
MIMIDLWIFKSLRLLQRFNSRESKIFVKSNPSKAFPFGQLAGRTASASISAEVLPVTEENTGRALELLLTSITKLDIPVICPNHLFSMD